MRRPKLPRFPHSLIDRFRESDILGIADHDQSRKILLSKVEGIIPGGVIHNDKHIRGSSKLNQRPNGRNQVLSTLIIHKDGCYHLGSRTLLHHTISSSNPRLTETPFLPPRQTSYPPRFGKMPRNQEIIGASTDSSSPFTNKLITSSEEIARVTHRRPPYTPKETLPATMNGDPTRR